MTKVNTGFFVDVMYKTNSVKKVTRERWNIMYRVDDLQDFIYRDGIMRDETMARTFIKKTITLLNNIIIEIRLKG